MDSVSDVVVVLADLVPVEQAKSWVGVCLRNEHVVGRSVIEGVPVVFAQREPDDHVGVRRCEHRVDPAREHAGGSAVVVPEFDDQDVDR